VTALAATGRPRRMPASALLSRLRGGPAAGFLYAVLATLTFPTLETLRFGTAAPNYSHDVFDADGAVPRIGATITQLRDLGLSLWDPRIGTGVPTLGHGAITPLAPDVLVGLVAGPFVGYAVVAWLLAFAAGWGMHRFLRDSAGLPVAACLLGGAVFLFSFWHYAIGFAPAGENWRNPLKPGQGPGFTEFAVHYAPDEAGARALADRLGTTPLVVSTLMAAPRPL